MKIEKLRRIQEAASIRKIPHQEVSPPLSAYSQREIRRWRAKGSVLLGKAAVRRVISYAGARNGIYHHTGFVPVFCLSRPGYYLQRLDGIQRNLVGEDLAVLVGDGLIVERNLGLGVIAQRVKETVGVSRY